MFQRQSARGEDRCEARRARLVARVAVNRAHEAFFHAKRVIQHLHHRREAVVVQDAFENDVVARRIVLIAVDADAERQIRLLRWSGDHDFLWHQLRCACLRLRDRQRNRSIRGRYRRLLRPNRDLLGHALR